MKVCRADGCIEETKSRFAEWCWLHYMRVYRTGSPDLRPKRTAVACEVEGCERDAKTRGMCAMHAERVRHHNDPGVVLNTRRDDAGYGAAHYRVGVDRGPATELLCVDCGDRAKQWAYDHADPDERTSPVGAYSLNPVHYLPMCIPCHKRFDLGRAVS